MFWARNGGRVTDSVFIWLNHLYLIGKMGSCNSVNRTCSITSCNHFSSEGITIWSKQLNKHRYVILLLMKLNVAQYTGHTEFMFISLEGFSLLKPKMCGLWDQDVAWLAGFAAFQTEKVIIHSTPQSHRRISCLEPQKSCFQPACVTPAFQNPFPLWGACFLHLPWGPPKLWLSYLTMTSDWSVFSLQPL